MLSELSVPILVVCIVTGIVCSRVAKNRGYDPVYGFAVGFFLSILGIGIYAARKRRNANAAR